MSVIESPFWLVTKAVLPSDVNARACAPAAVGSSGTLASASVLLKTIFPESESVIQSSVVRAARTSRRLLWSSSSASAPHGPVALSTSRRMRSTRSRRIGGPATSTSSRMPSWARPQSRSARMSDETQAPRRPLRAPTSTLTSRVHRITRRPVSGAVAGRRYSTWISPIMPPSPCSRMWQWYIQCPFSSKRLTSFTSLFAGMMMVSLLPVDSSDCLTPFFSRT